MSSQAIHFRGHRDSEKLFEKQSFGQNEGNCNSFMLNASHNATYISPEYQLKFIKHSARKIVLRILNRVRTSQIFSISFDVTTDASGKNILSMVVRYVDAETDEIHEDFLGLEWKETHRNGHRKDDLFYLSSKEKGAITYLKSISLHAVHCYCFYIALICVLVKSLGFRKSNGHQFSRYAKRNDVLKRNSP